MKVSHSVATSIFTVNFDCAGQSKSKIKKMFRGEQERFETFMRNTLLPSWLAKSSTQMVIHPLVRAQIVLQTQSCSRIPEDEKLNHFNEKFSAPTLIAVDDGLFSLWKSFLFNIARSVPTIVVQYVLQKLIFKNVHNENVKIALSAICSDVLLYPLEVIEVVYMADRSEDGKFVGGQTFQFQSLLDCVIQMYKNANDDLRYKGQGSDFFSTVLSAYYRGFLFRTMCVSVPTHLGTAYLESRLQQGTGVFRLRDLRKNVKSFYYELSEKMSTKDFFVSKFLYIAKVYAMKTLMYLFLYPFDTVSRKLQVNGQPGYLNKYESIKDCIVTTFYEECYENVKDMTINNGFLNGFLFRSVAIPFTLLLPPLVFKVSQKLFGNKNNSTKKFSLISN